MSESNPYRVYVVHIFQPSEDYQRVFEYLESRDNFFYVNSANIESMPATGGTDAIKEELRNQIKPAEVAIMPIATFESNPDLVRFQMDMVQACKIPLLAIESFGGTVAIQKEIVDRCADMIEWNDRTLISAIKMLARGEDTSQWETIEFNLD